MIDDIFEHLFTQCSKWIIKTAICLIFFCFFKLLFQFLPLGFVLCWLMADGCQDFGSFSVFCFDPTEKAFGFPIHNQLGLFSSSSINMFLLPIFLVWCLFFGWKETQCLVMMMMPPQKLPSRVVLLWAPLHTFWCFGSSAKLTHTHFSTLAKCWSSQAGNCASERQCTNNEIPFCCCPCLALLAVVGRIFFFCGPLRAWWLMLKADYYLHWANGVLAFSSSLLPTPQKPHLVIGIYKLKILAIAPNCLLRKERGPVHSFLLLLLGTFTTTTITTTTARWGLMAMGEYSIWRKILVC